MSQPWRRKKHSEGRINNLGKTDCRVKRILNGVVVNGPGIDVEDGSGNPFQYLTCEELVW